MAAPPAQRVSYRAIFAWAVGSLGGCYVLSSINLLALPIYNIALGVDAVKLGWALSLPRVIDAVFDPMVGWLSDNTRGRWGRRKPYIVAGAFPLGLFTLLLWIPPRGASPEVLFWYFLVISVLYYLSFSITSVPLTALGFELSEDYNERTRIMGWGSIFGTLGGLSVPWLYKITLLPIFGGNEIEGVRWVGAMLAVVIFFSCLAPGIFCQERPPQAERSKIGLFRGIWLTLGNGPFRLLVVSNILLIVLTSMVGPCLFYLNIYQVCGSKAGAAELVGWAFTVQLLAAFAGVPFNTKLAQWLGKLPAMMVCLAITLLGSALYAVTLTPKYPYLQIVSNVLIGWGIQGVWVMYASMTPDVCDDDELKTGHRREAFYGSAMGFCSKTGLALAALASGYIVHFAGYHEGVIPGPEVMARMHRLFVWWQIIGLLTGALIMFFYPLNRRRMDEIRAELDARHAARIAG